MGFLLTLLLVVVGLLLLFLSLAGVAFGAYMALDERNRERGVFFAVWWIPAVAASGGVLMRDWVTFTVGVICFAVAGVALALGFYGSQRPARGRRTSSKEAGKLSLYRSAKRRLSDKIKEYRKAAS